MMRWKMRGTFWKRRMNEDEGHIVYVKRIILGVILRSSSMELTFKYIFSMK